MLHIQSFVFNHFQEKTYVLYNDDNECWIIDPGMYEPYEHAVFMEFIGKHKLHPQAIINTHAHIDHIFGVNRVAASFNIPFGLHKDDLPVLEYSVHSAALFGLSIPPTIKPTLIFNDGDVFQAGGDQLRILHCPGHSPGSVAFYYEPGKWVIGGDVLFAGSIGRTDLPGGNFLTLINSIQTKLFSLPLDTKVYSGHGHTTTLQEEKLHNPFLQ
jgi:hydroxyacylglutathione hydrolase